MSAALLGLALKAKLHSQTRKMVLIKLVDCCQEDGTRIYPSLATIAEDAECSVPTARRVMQTFCRVGLLRKVRDGGSGAKSTNHYEMDIDLLAKLRRPEMWPALEAAAVHQPLTDSDDDDEAAGHAPDAGSGAREAGSPGANKGITVEGYHRDSLPNPAEGYHPDDTQPLSRNLNYEREGAREREGTPASEGEPEQADQPTATLTEFRAAWPNVHRDSQKAIEAAWEALPFTMRRPAIDGIKPFLADLGPRKFQIAASTYLSERRWTLLPARAAERAAAANSAVRAWTRDWWRLVLFRIMAGQRVGYTVQSGQAITATAREQEQARQQLGELHAYLCTGPELAAWRPWLAARGARIPDMRGDARVFLPSPMPPGGKRDAGDDDVRF
ncbi:MAG: hypothetical protein C0458_04380 [Methylobacterium sp.]|nr:hypothetical protein [Methylobacterium sp.]